MPAARGVAEWTPELTDTFHDLRTWQLNGTQRVFKKETPGRTIDG
ncbi:MAG TPA: hypothetical protein VNI77_05825 [Nitrososphaera sp.]|nr:hypothetical protein [Nitrososphaera sp.]